MAKSIVIAGASFPDVPAIEVPKQNEGVAKFWDRDFEQSCFGAQIEKVGDFYNKTIKLSATTYPSWTPTTTATSIYSGEAATAQNIDPAHYEYYVRWRTKIIFARIAGATLKAAPDMVASSYWYSIHRRPYGLATFATMEDVRQYVTVMSSSSLYYIYYNSSGTRTWTTTGYGVYTIAVAPTLGSATADTTTVNASTPTLSARTNTSYAAAARVAEIDAENTTIQMVATLFRTPIGGSSLRGVFRDAMWCINNGLLTEVDG